MPRYRKRPIEIEAIQLVSAKAGQARQLGPTQIPDWFAIAQSRGVITNATDPDGEEIDGLFIHTLEGVHLASPGDWIIQGVAGEIYPCKPDIFEATYDRAENGDSFVVPQALGEDIAALNARDARMQRALANIAGIAKEALLAGPEITPIMSEEVDREIERRLPISKYLG